LSAIKLVDYDNSALLRKEEDKIGIKKGTPEYMAPEVHAGIKYDYKCDVWSCGVLAYQLLSNMLPFGDSGETSEEEIALKVEEGKFSMSGPAWGGVSADAKDFVKHLLILRDKKRPSAEKALTHKFLSGASAAGNAGAAQTVILAGNAAAMSAMSNFKKYVFLGLGRLVCKTDQYLNTLVAFCLQF
jgi:serine/threonine protein kinase